MTGVGKVSNECFPFNMELTLLTSVHFVLFFFFQVLSSYCLFHVSTLYFLFYLTYSKDFGDEQAVASQRDDGNGKYLVCIG